MPGHVRGKKDFNIAFKEKDHRCVCCRKRANTLMWTELGDMCMACSEKYFKKIQDEESKKRG